MIRLRGRFTHPSIPSRQGRGSENLSLSNESATIIGSGLVCYRLRVTPQRGQRGKIGQVEQSGIGALQKARP